MSLQLAAQHLAAQGRGPDTTLVHMTPGEVAGLQAIARAHGGSLTVNPQTGLPEAGFLSRLLPTIAGMILTPVLGPIAAPLLVGGVTAAATGSLTRGLMAGLGAYGGGGIGSALSNAGTGAVSAAAGAGSDAAINAAAGAAGAGLPGAAGAGLTGFGGTAADIAQMADVGMGAGAGAVATPVVPPTAVTGTAIPPPLNPEAATIGQPMIRPLGMPPQTATPMSTPPVQAAAQPVAPSTAYDPATDYWHREEMAKNAVARDLAKTTPTGTMKAGLQEIMKPGRMMPFLKANATNIGMAAAPIMFGGGSMKAVPTSSGNIQYYDFDNTTNQWTYKGSVPASEVDKAGGYEQGRALVGRARGGLAALAAGGVARFAEGGDSDKSYNTPRDTGFVPLFGFPQSSTAPASTPEPDYGPAIAGPYEPGYVEPTYDPSKDPGNYFANPPAGASFEKFKPGQETEQGYFSRLREYYESPEGQAYTQKQEADRLAAVEAIRAQYFGPGTLMDVGAPTPGATTPGVTVGPGAPTPAAPTPGGAPTPAAPTPGAPAPIPSTPGMPPVSPPPYTGGEGVIGSPDLITRAYQDFWVGTPVGSEISWAGGKLKRIGAAQAVFTGPDGKTITLAPGSDLNSIAANNPNIGELWRQEFGLVPKNYMTGSSYDAYEYLMGRGKYPTIQRGIIQDEYAPLAFGEDVAPYRGKYRPNYETGQMERNPDYKAPYFPGLPGGQYSIPEEMQDAYDAYWKSGAVGSEINWAGGKLKRVSPTKAIYTPPEGDPVTLYKSSNLYDIAQKSPNIAALWEEEFGFKLMDEEEPSGGRADFYDNSGGTGGNAKGGLLRRNTGGIVALAGGGYNLGDYSDGGRLLKGPGDGVSDSIPATIGNRRPARLADGEFVVPARIVSELGNGSTNAGARKLYQMMNRIQSRRSKTVGKKKVAVDSKADKYLPA